jgi:hypothetical protein
MIVDVPYVYQRPAREQGKRKFVPMNLRASTSVRLGEVEPEAFPVAITFVQRDLGLGVYRHETSIRMHEGSLYVPVVGYPGGHHHATAAALTAHIAKGCRSDLSRGLPQLEATWRDPKDEASLQFDPDHPGNRQELAAMIALNAAETFVCGGGLWRRMDDEPLLVAVAGDRFNAPGVDWKWRKDLLRGGPLDCERHFRLDQLAEAMLALDIDLDFDLDVPATLYDHVWALPQVLIPEAIRHRHDQGPALAAAAAKAVISMQKELDALPTEALLAWGNLRDAVVGKAEAARIADAFTIYADAIQRAGTDEPFETWRREIAKWEASPVPEVEAAWVGPRP